jgi:hypothetical protein
LRRAGGGKKVRCESKVEKRFELRPVTPQDEAMRLALLPVKGAFKRALACAALA